MSYSFPYTITAKCYRMEDCLGTPADILLNWARLTPSGTLFSVDEEGWLKKQDESAQLVGFYDQMAIGLQDYSIVVPVIPPQLNSGAVGVLFRIADRNNYYCFLWDDGALGWANNQRLLRVKEGIPTILAESNSPLSGGYMHLIEIEAASSRIVIRADGKRVFDYTDGSAPLLYGSYGVAALQSKGARFAGVYRRAVAKIDVSREFTGSVKETSLGLINSELVNGTAARNLLLDAVNLKRTQLGISSEELIVYGYTVQTSDLFVQPYFDVGEPVVYSQYGNYYTYAYLKQVPRVPEAPQNFRGSLEGLYINWTWNDVSTIENGYFLYDSTGKRIITLPAGTTSYREPLADDGLTVTRRLTAYNNVGESAAVEASVFVPVIAPPAPIWFEGRAVSTGVIVWSWSAVPLAEKYELVDENEKVIAILPAGTYSFREEGLEAATVYRRGIRAVRKSKSSETVYATVKTFGSADTTVDPPVNFYGEALSPRVARWLWTHSGGADHFLLIDTGGTIIAQIPGDERSYIEFELEAGHEYTRILVAADSTGRMSAPVMATVKLDDNIDELPCEPLPPEPRYVNGFASGIGDDDDLKTALEYGKANCGVMVYATGRTIKTEEVEEPAECRVRFTAEGTRQVERDYGSYDLEITAQPGHDVEFDITAAVREIKEVEYHLEANVDYLANYPVDVPFEAEIVGYVRDPGALTLEGTCQVHCEADIGRKEDIPFDYQVKITYTSEDPQYKPLVDIVWIVDYSGSMGAHMSAVAQNAASFVNSLNANNIDFRLAVTAYERSAYKRTSGGKEWTTSASEFASMVQISTSGGTENGIGATLFALNNYSFRPDALKYFVILTDENADDAGFYNISSVINTLKASNAVFSCIYNPSDAYPYPDIASGTGGVAINIGSADWGATLASLVNNIKARVTLTAVLGQNSSLRAIAPYGADYVEVDPRTLAQIVADLIASGQSGLPQDFLTSGYNTITEYRLLPPTIDGLHVSLSNGTLVSGDGSAKIVAYSTATSITRQVFSSTPFSITAPAGCIDPLSAAKSDQTCRQIIAPLIENLLTTDQQVVSVTPARYWATAEGALKAFTCSPEGFDYVRWYRTDLVMTYRKNIGGVLNGTDTEADPAVVTAERADVLITEIIPPGYEPLREFSYFAGLGWRLGSAPFNGFREGDAYTAGVLEKVPSVAYFVKDVDLPAAPAAATIYIASDDGMALYVNGTPVINDTGKNHAASYWNYTLDITQYLKAGRNRIAVLVDNGHQNNGTASGVFDCELAVTINNQMTYPILRGSDNYGHDACLWWYYGLPQGISTPPRDARERDWYEEDYGLLDLTAHRVESSTPGVAAFIDEAGLVRAYVTTLASTGDRPEIGTWRVTAQLTTENGEMLECDLFDGQYGISGVDMNYNVSGAKIRNLVMPELLMWLNRERPGAWITSVQYNVATTGSADAAATAADGTTGVLLRTAVPTFTPVHENITICTEALLFPQLDENASEENPQVFLGTPPDSPLPTHMLGCWNGECVEKVEAESSQAIKSGQYGLSPDGTTVWLSSGWVEVVFTQPADTVLVQFNNSDHNDGYALVYVDGQSYGPFLTLNRGDNYIYIAGLPQTAHTVRVEDAGGGDLHIDWFATASGYAPTAAAVLAPYLAAAPELKDTSWTVRWYKAVSHSPECIVYTDADGTSPIYGYPLIPVLTYTKWSFSKIIHACDGDTVLVRTADLQPLDRFGKAAEAESWRLSVRKADESVETRWANSESDITGGPDEVIGRSSDTTSVRTTTSGYVLSSSPLSVIPAAFLSEAGSLYAPAFIIRLNGDNNVYAATQDSTIGPGESMVLKNGNQTVTIGAYTTFDEKPWWDRGPWHELKVKGTARIYIDITPPDGAAALFGFELESGDGVEAQFESGQAQTANLREALVLSGSKTVTRQKSSPWCGSPTLHLLPDRLAYNEETSFTVTVLPPERDYAYDPLIQGELVDVQYICLPLYPGIEASIERVEQEPEAIKATVRVKASRKPGLPWHPASQTGFYYYQGEERYLHAACNVANTAAGKQAADTEVTLLVRGAFTADEEPLIEDIPTAVDIDFFKDQTVDEVCSRRIYIRDLLVTNRISADGNWYAVTDDDISVLFAERTDVAELGALPTRLLVQQISGTPVELNYNPTGTGSIRARVQEVVFGNPANTAIVGEEGTATVYPTPEPLAPVCVLLTDGTVLRHAPFVNTEGKPVLENTEVLSGNGAKTVKLAYRGVDPATVSLRYKPEGSGQWYRLSRFQLCNHELRLPVTVTDRDVLEVTYRLMDSFVIRADEPPGGATILIHSNKVKAGDAIQVYYETSGEDALRHWDGPDLNPLFTPVSEGFLWLDHKDDTPGRVLVQSMPETIEEGTSQPVRVVVTVLSAAGAPCTGVPVAIRINEAAPIETVTDEFGRAEVLLQPQFSAGPIRVVATSGEVSGVTELVVLPAEPSVTLTATPISNVLYSSERISIKTLVRSGVIPLSGVKVGARCTYGSLDLEEMYTDIYGEAVLTYTAPISGNVLDTVEIWLPEHPEISTTVPLYIGEAVSMLRQVDNRVEDIPADYTVQRLGLYDIATLTTTPPEWL